MPVVKPLVRYADTGRIEELRALDSLPSSDAALTPAKFRQQALANSLRPRNGLIVPMYIAPDNIYTNTTYNQLIDFAKQYSDVPVKAILNVFNGPGSVVSPNYTAAFKRLRGANIQTMGYVPTGYNNGSRTLAQIKADIDLWQQFYPFEMGIFLDEMSNTDTPANISFYRELRDYCHGKGLYPVVANPGVLLPTNILASACCDQFTIFETNVPPVEANLKGDFDGGNADFSYWSRSAMVLNSNFDISKIDLVRKYAVDIYVTDDNLPNPYDTLPTYLESVFRALSAPSKLDVQESTGRNVYRRWLDGLQFKSGAAKGAIRVHSDPNVYVNSVAYYKIEPYFASLAVYFAMKADPIAARLLARDWINWWAGHRNATTKTALIHYYQINGTGEATSFAGDPVTPNNEDATDSNAALWFACAALYVQHFDQEGLSPNILTAAQEVYDYLSSPALKQSDNLTWAKPNFQIKYLLDNVEVWAGLQGAVQVFRALGDTTRASAASTWAGLLQNQLNVDFKDSAQNLWRPQKDANGVLTAAALTPVYPQALCQIWPTIFDYDKTFSGFKTFSDYWTGWDTTELGGANSATYPSIAVAAIKAGEPQRARRWLANIAAKRFDGTTFSWNFTSADAGLAWYCACMVEASDHAHAIASVPGLQGALDAKAAAAHTHVIADVTNLQTSLNAKQNTLVSSTNIKTVNGQTLLGAGDVVIAPPSSATATTIATLVASAQAGSLVAGALYFVSDLRGFAMAVTSSDFEIQDGQDWVRADWYSVGNSTTLAVNGHAALSITGTLTSVAQGVTSVVSILRRTEVLVNTAALGAVAGLRSATGGGWYPGGPAANKGGFLATLRGAQATGAATTTSRFFMGLANTLLAPTDVDPSTITNIIGVGYDAADTSLTLMYRGSAAVTKLALGANFPKPTADRTAMYELELYAVPGSTQSVSYRVRNMVTDSTTSGTITSNLPTTGTSLSPRIWASTGGATAVTGVVFSSINVSSKE